MLLENIYGKHPFGSNSITPPKQVGQGELIWVVVSMMLTAIPPGQWGRPLTSYALADVWKRAMQGRGRLKNVICMSIMSHAGIPFHRANDWVQLVHNGERRWFSILANALRTIQQSPNALHQVQRIVWHTWQDVAHEYNDAQRMLDVLIYQVAGLLQQPLRHEQLLPALQKYLQEQLQTHPANIDAITNIAGKAEQVRLAALMHAAAKTCALPLLLNWDAPLPGAVSRRDGRTRAYGDLRFLALHLTDPHKAPPFPRNSPEFRRRTRLSAGHIPAPSLSVLAPGWVNFGSYADLDAAQTAAWHSQVAKGDAVADNTADLVGAIEGLHATWMEERRRFCAGVYNQLHALVQLSHTTPGTEERRDHIRRLGIDPDRAMRAWHEYTSGVDAVSRHAEARWKLRADEDDRDRSLVEVARESILLEPGSPLWTPFRRMAAYSGDLRRVRLARLDNDATTQLRISYNGRYLLIVRPQQNNPGLMTVVTILRTPPSLEAQALEQL